MDSKLNRQKLHVYICLELPFFFDYGMVEEPPKGSCTLKCYTQFRIKSSPFDIALKPRQGEGEPLIWAMQVFIGLCVSKGRMVFKRFWCNTEGMVYALWSSVGFIIIIPLSAQYIVQFFKPTNIYKHDLKHWSRLVSRL